MQCVSKFVFKLVTLVAFSFVSLVYAEGVGINSLRIIYPAGKQDVMTGLRNTSDITYLMQSYISNVSGGKPGNTYFDVVPGVMKLAAHQEGNVRVVATEKVTTLPHDRESIFYFTTRGVPASDPLREAAGGRVGAGLVVSLSSQIKLFYRPEGLSETGASQAAHGLKFRRILAGIVVENNSPYYVSLRGLLFGKKRVPLLSLKDMGMVAPFGALSLPVGITGQANDVSWGAVNDLGGVDVYNGKVS